MSMNVRVAAKSRASAVRPVRAALCALGSLAAAACTVGPDYRQPEAQVPAEWSIPGAETSVPVSTLSGDGADVARWWSALNDPTLTSLIERGARANYDVRRAEARIREARASREIAESGLWPRVGLSAGAGRSRHPVGSGGVTSNLFQLGLDASWELDVFGGTRRAIEAAEAEEVASIEDRRDVLVTLAGEIALNYTDLRTAQERVRVARRNLVAQERSLDIARRKVAGGLGTSLDVANAEAQTASTRSSLPALDASIRQSIYTLSTLLGLEPTALEAELIGEGTVPLVPPDVPIGLPSDLLRRRPDIRRGEAQLHAATARVGVATAELFPKFSLTGGVGLQSGELESLLDLSGRSWSAGAGVSWPLFDAGRNRAAIELARAVSEETLLAYRGLVLTALRDVQSALISYAREQDRRASLIASVEANRRAVDLSQRLYREGATDFLNVLTAQRSLYATEELLTLSTSALTTDLISIYKALGGGWESLEEARTDGAPEPGMP